MVRSRLFTVIERRLTLFEADELGGDGTSLVHQLVKTVLAVGAWLSKDDGACLDTLR